MKKVVLMIVVAWICGVVFTGCDKNDPKSEDDIIGIEDITFDNYPIVDGSTSARELSRMVAYKLLGVRCAWGPGFLESAVWCTHCEEDMTLEQRVTLGNRLRTSQTHGAFINLIDGNADIILTHRTMSPDEKAYAETGGVTLIEIPIALDPFVFVVNLNNPVKSLTVEQIRKIYTGEITRWSEVGGNNAEIKVFTRPRNSGSEEVFRSLVMKDLEPLDFPESVIASMMGVFPELRDADGICYTFNAYKELQANAPDNYVPKIAINGIFPGETTVQNRTYPFISEVHVAIRSDLDRNSMAYKLYEWLQTENVKSILMECGFIPK
jgi:phosphate transport system substrate-binding protein